VSDEVKESGINDCKISSNKLVVINNGIDIDKTISLSHEKIDNDLSHLFDYNFKYIGIVGRLEPAKNHLNFLTAAQSILLRYPSCQFIIVGAGKLYPQLKLWVEHHHLNESIHFLGFRRNPLKYIKYFDVAVLSSDREGLPIALLEYMALSRPIVSTNTGGIKAALHHLESGLLVETRNPKALSNAIIRLLEDRKLSERLAVTAFNCVSKNFSSKTMLKQHEKLYLDAITSKRIPI
jgi:glycosyltransferase involved in cell wall biosynthesis